MLGPAIKQEFLARCLVSSAAAPISLHAFFEVLSIVLFFGSIITFVYRKPYPGLLSEESAKLAR
jgi:hypothetical protein